MFDVDTLFVISSNRGTYVIEDLLASIAWTCTNGSHFTVVIDENGTIENLSATDRYQILHSDLPPETPSGFHRAAGLKWAIDQGIAYRQIIMLADTCLIVTQTLDAFFAEHTQKEGVGVIGVRDQRQHEKVWRDAQSQLFEWKLPVADWEIPPISLCDDILIMAARFVAPMFQKGLLIPAGCETWPGTYGAYVSWVCHMLNFYAVSWGFETNTLPPLYVNHAQGQYLPPPHILGNQFLVYSPANKVMAYSEGDLRELYKQRRGERFREVNKLQPVVTGPEQSDVKTVM